MKNKLTKEKIELIKKLRLEGKKKIEISKIINVSPSTIYYHLLSEKERLNYNKRRMEYFRSLPLEIRQKKYERQKEYNKNYRRERYKQDPTFREKEKKYQREYQKRKYQERKKNK